ncbi:MAG: hypothetical protein HRU48_22350 [Vibrio sp.]|uniref:hypothetical protein n=1 Tax=Vibrio TaxID=662 RepID=UPI001ED5293A|nr:hypothetical protein [Vibrio sp.]NRB70059.1 hypothetical protein [Vibrio sp.]
MMENMRLVDQVKVKVECKPKYNTQAEEINGFLKLQPNKAGEVAQRKIFVATNKEEDATVFCRYTTLQPKDTGYYYVVKGSEDDDGTVLYMDEETTSGIVYANRSSLNGEFTAQKTIHSWKITESTKHKTSRLSAFLTGHSPDLFNEALAVARKDQLAISKQNGGKEIFCNSKKSRDGLVVEIITINVNNKELENA